MKISRTGIDLVKEFEGFYAKAYLCPAGLKTIGYGHVIRAGETFEVLTHKEAEELLLKDLSVAERAVERLIDVPLTQGQFDALVSFTFNLGAGALQRSTLRRKINRSEHESAMHEFSRWVRCGLRVLPGLVKRRAAEAQMYGMGM